MAFTITCEQCGTPFEAKTKTRRFCSQSCSGKASLPRMDPAERKCKVDGCDEMRVRTEPGYCRRHDYRYRFYGDPLAETTRQPRDSSGPDLDVDWEELESVRYWEKNPSHCPSGHEYTEENTGWRTLRDGKKRRLCKACNAEAYQRRVRGETRDRTATCVTCGVVWEASKFGTVPKFCQSCRVKRQKANMRLVMAKKRGQTPKGATYTCTVCGVVSPTPATVGMPPKLCDVCANQNILDQKKRLWVDKTLKRYSLTAERFAEIVEAQGNRCAICGTSEPGGKIARWHIDHDHSCCGPGVSCGKCVRGLLCSRCNTAVGLFADDPSTLSAALNYLKDPPAQKL